MPKHLKKLNVTINKAQRRYVLAQPFVPQSLDIPLALHERLTAAMQSLSIPVGVELAQVAQNIQRLSELTPSEQARNGHIAPLLHRLGELSLSRCYASTHGVPWRMELEESVLHQRCHALLQSLEQPTAEAFIAELLTISALVKGFSSTTFRTSGVRLVGDKTGWSWQFPEVKGINPCLQALYDVLHQRCLNNAMLEATVAYAILNWMHPFADGNGRTSRVVFNAILRRGGMQENLYFPIKEINYLARGGHEVRLRYTVATGDWRDLLENFVNAAELYGVLLQKEVFQSNWKHHDS